MSGNAEKKEDGHQDDGTTNSAGAHIPDINFDSQKSGNAADADGAQRVKNGAGKASGTETGSKPLTQSGIRLGSGIQIIRITERHGQFRKAVPIMPLPVAIFLCLINCILPGVGTLISGFTVFCGTKTEVESRTQAFWLNVAAFVLQVITLPIIVGWIWSIIWGVTFISIAMNKDGNNDNYAPGETKSPDGDQSQPV